jgi:hypothetical protein
MKIIVRTLMLCATIAAMNNAYAHYSGLGERMSMPSSHEAEALSHSSSPQEPVNTKYPMIKKHAPEKIKELCRTEQLCGCNVVREEYCSECDIVEKMLWCANKQQQRYMTSLQGQDLYQYCQSCIDENHEQSAMFVIDAVARKANLTHDQAAALLHELNNVIRSLERASRLRPRED